MDRLASMGAFVKVVEAGSFAAAAVKLGISPQMVAKHVTYLESRLGTRLLNRTTRQQSLTEIGRTYYERCRSVLAEVEWADALADEAKGSPRGRLRINAPVSFGASLTPLVTRYLRQNTEVEIDLVLNDRFVDLIEEGFEAVFRVGPLADSSLMARELSPFRMVACASPVYLRERGTPSIPTHLEHHECLGYTHWARPMVYEWRFVQSGQVYEVRIRNRLQANDAKALLTAALDGFGIVLVAENLVGDGLSSGQLVRVLPDFDIPARPMHLLFHPERRQTPKLRTFIEAVVQEFGPKGASTLRHQ